MGQWIETNGSRSATIQRKGKNAESTVTQTWRAFGYSSDSALHAEANARFSTNRFYGVGDYVMMVENYTVAHVADDVWDVTVTYVKKGADETDPLRRTRSFDTGGATMHMTQAIPSTTYIEGEERWPKTGTLADPPAPSQQGAIGVDGETVKGVEVVTPALTWTESYDVPSTYVTQTYIKMLAELTGTVNKAAFKSFAAYEVLFVGASGSQEWDSEKGDGPWNLSFKFNASGNAGSGQTYPALKIGSIIDVEKKGHDFLWVTYKSVADTGSNTLLRVPKYVYVNKVYRESDFRRLGIGT
jgi:hypothetical protein